MTITKIQMFAQTGCLGGFTHALPDGRVCYYAEAELGARGVKLWMQASPMAGEQMPSDAAYKVFNDTRRLIEAAPDLLEELSDAIDLLEIVQDDERFTMPERGNLKRVLTKARSAITRAKGRAPM